MDVYRRCIACVFRNDIREQTTDALLRKCNTTLYLCHLLTLEVPPSDFLVPTTREP